MIWHVLRPLSGDDLRRGERLRLVQKLGAGVNTIDVETATKCGICLLYTSEGRPVRRPHLGRHLQRGRQRHALAVVTVGVLVV